MVLTSGCSILFEAQILFGSGGVQLVQLGDQVSKLGTCLQNVLQHGFDILNLLDRLKIENHIIIGKVEYTELLYIYICLKK